MNGWISRDEALALLGIRQQTLYAYVSRKLVAARPDPSEPRRSFYSRADVERLLARRSRGRRAAEIAESAIDWGEAVLTTAISTVAGGRLFYRGRDAGRLAVSVGFEDAVALLWNADDMGSPDKLLEYNPGLPPVEAALSMLARAAANAEPTMGRSPARLIEESVILLRSTAAALGSDLSSGRGVAEGLARRWKGDRQAVDMIRMALVVTADHELNASTFAARVTASTGAPLAAAVLSGLSALLGPAHGGATLRVRALVEAAEREGAQIAIQRWLARGEPLPGFGHRLYPDIDPRAAVLLARLDLPDALENLAHHAASITGLRPNIDFALVAITRAHELPADAPFLMFAAARTAGWLAHAMEQASGGRLIRPRARYSGPPAETVT